MASCECVDSGLDLFTVPPTQTSVEEGQYVEHHPLATLTDSGPIEFLIRSPEQYVDLTSSYLHIQAQVTKEDGTDLVVGDDNKVVPVNLFLAALFREVDVTWNNQLVSSASNAYPYRAYLETLLSYGRAAKETQLCAAMFYKDTAGQFNAVATDTNAGIVKRKARSTRSRVMDMIGRIHADVFAQGKYLLNGVDVRVRLVRSKDEFCLLASEAYKVKIIKASLLVRTVTLNPAVRLAHAKALERATAKYPIQRVVTKCLSVGAGSMNIIQDNLFLDQMPKRIILGMVDSSAFNGNFHSTPFEFKHYNTNFVALYRDGKAIPSKPYTQEHLHDQVILTCCNMYLACIIFFFCLSNKIFIKKFQSKAVVSILFALHSSCHALSFDTKHDIFHSKTKK